MKTITYTPKDLITAYVVLTYSMSIESEQIDDSGYTSIMFDGSCFIKYKIIQFPFYHVVSIFEESLPTEKQMMSLDDLRKIIKEKLSH